MKLFKLSTKQCALIFFFSCLLLCGLLAWKIGEIAAIESIWVPREKIVGAEPYTQIEQVNIGRGLLFGIPIFMVGGLFSAALSELYYAALRYFRGESA